MSGNLCADGRLTRCPCDTDTLMGYGHCELILSHRTGLIKPASSESSISLYFLGYLITPDAQIMISDSIVCFFMFAGTQPPLTQPPAPAVQPTYQPPRQQQQQQAIHAEPHYATPRQYAMQQPLPQREPQYDRQQQQQPAYRQYEEQPYGGPRGSGPQLSSWQQQTHPAYDQRQQQQHPNYHQQQSRPESQYMQPQQPRSESQYNRQQPQQLRSESQYDRQQPAYSAQLRHPYEPQQQYPGRVASAFESSYAGPPPVTRDGRITASRSKSASDLNQPEAWPTQPSLQYGGRAPQPQEPPLSLWKSYEGPPRGQRGLTEDARMQEPVRVDRRIGPDTRPYSDHWPAADRNRSGPYWHDSDRRSQPQLNVTRQPPPNAATHSSHPELTNGGTRQFFDTGKDAAAFTSSDMLRRAQPSQQGVTSPTPFSQQASTASGSTLERRTSVPVGGHLRAIDPKQQMAPGLPPQTTTEHHRPQSHYRPPSQMTAATTTESSYTRPAVDRSQSLSRGVQLGSGPWERAQKEEEQRHVELEQKRRRDEEIRYLEAQLPDQLSSAEIDRLRRLKLNAEFDRRAMELERSGEPPADTNTDMTPAVSGTFSLQFTSDFGFTVL